MKIRKSFVANSSSSSFICEICGHTEVGYDNSASDFEMIRCVNEHLMCREHLLTDDEEESPDWGENVATESACPICQFQAYVQNDMVEYLKATYGVTKEDVFAEIKKVNKRRKKLYDYEYITHVFQQHNITDDMVLNDLRVKFSTYADFAKHVYNIKYGKGN